MMPTDAACYPRPERESPIEDLFAPLPPDPHLMPADPRDQRTAIAYWRARGVRPSWAGRVDADRLVTRVQLARVRRLAAKGDAEIVEVVALMADQIKHLSRQLSRGGVQ